MSFQSAVLIIISLTAVIIPRANAASSNSHANGAGTDETLRARTDGNDCRTKVGTYEITHRGRGIFSRSTYKLRVTFEPKGDLVASWDWGRDKTAKLYRDADGVRYGTGSGLAACKQDVYKCLDQLEQFDADLRLALPLVDDRDQQATLRCVMQRLGERGQTIAGGSSSRKGKKGAGCGENLGEVTVEHYGKGAFAWSKYRLKLGFQSNGDLSFHWDWGRDWDGFVNFSTERIKVHHNREVNCWSTWKNQRACNNQLFTLGEELEEVEKRLTAASKQSDQVQKALACAISSVKGMFNHITRDYVDGTPSYSGSSSSRSEWSGTNPYYSQNPYRSLNPYRGLDPHRSSKWP
jgi:hypothetical protein